MLPEGRPLRLLLLPLLLLPGAPEEDELLVEEAEDEEEDVEPPADDDEVRDNEGTELEVALLDPISTSPPLLVDGPEPGPRCDVLRLPLLLL